ncbi:PKD domain-containing protein [Hymenobacter seoulensis]
MNKTFNLFGFPTRRNLQALAGSLLTAGLLACNFSASAQLVLTGSAPATENFDGMGTTVSAAPVGFKFSADAAPTYGNASAYTSPTQASNGNNFTSGGTYNFGASTGTTFSDRAIGFVSSGSYLSPRHILLEVKNSTGGAVQDVSVQFDIEKYRTGTRAYDWKFFTSADGITWTLQEDGSQSFAADLTSNTYFFSEANPPQSTPKTVKVAGVNLADGSSYYLRWTYQGVGGSTNAQALGLDNLRVTPTLAGGQTPTPTATLTTASVSPTSFCVTAAAGSAPFSVGFTGTGSFTGTYRVQLSDANGVFATLTDASIIGSGSASPILAAIPAGTASGNKYRVRVLNDTPLTYGRDNGTDLTIGLTPASNPVTVSPASAQTIPSTGTGTTLTASATAASTFSWQFSTSPSGPFTAIAGATAAAYQPQGTDFPGAGTFYLVARATAATSCGTVSGVSAPVAITVSSAPTVPSLQVSANTLPDFGTATAGAASAARSFTVSGNGLTSAVVITPPAGFEIRTGATAFACCAITLQPDGGSVPSTTIEVRFAPTGAEAYQAAIPVTSGGQAPQAVAVSGTGTSATYPATLTSAALTNLTPTSATTGGTILEDGGSPVTARGVVWSSTANPTLSNSKTVDGAGSGTFSSALTGLLPGTTYYTRAYATNAQGTTYGQEQVFSTVEVPLATEPSVQASLTAGLVTGTTIQLNLGGGDGQKRLVIARLGSPVDVLPSDATTYLADPSFGAGTRLNGGNVVVANGSADQVTITNLRPNTPYHFAVFAFSDNNTAYAENYLTTNPGTLRQETTPLPASLLLEENFEYTAGALLTANNWSAHSGAGSRSIAVTGAGLTYPGYSAQSGNAAAVVTSGEDVNRTFEPVYARTPVYVSALMKFSNASTTGDYFFHLGPKAIGGTFRSRVYARKNAANKLQLGISSGTGTVVYAPQEYEFNQTYLVVVKYTFDEAGNVSELFIAPSLTAEPATASARASETGTTPSAPNDNIGSIALRQGANSPAVVVDGIRVGTTYRVVATGLTCLQPTALFSAANACTGTAVQFTDASTSIEPNATYAWDINNDGQTDYTTVGSISHTYQDAGEYTVKLTITQGSCSETYTQQVVITSPPVVTPPVMATKQADANQCGASVEFAATATGSPTPTLTYSILQGGVMVPISSPYFFPVGTTQVTVTSQNSCGQDVQTFAVTVQDQQAPTVLAQPVTVSLRNGQATITAAQVNNGSFDACGIATMAVSPSTFTCDNIGDNQVTLTVTDIHGNTATQMAQVTVVGTIPTPAIAVTPATPQFAGAQAQTVYLGYGAQRLQLTATGGVSYQWSPATALSNAALANPVFAPTKAGVYTYTVTATSETGCTATQQVTLTVLDVRCGNKLEKVSVCHGGKALCVDARDVVEHLNHGDQLGACVPAAKPTTASQSLATSPASPAADLVFEASPNPFSQQALIHLRPAHSGAAVIQLYNSLGQLVHTYLNGPVVAGQQYEFRVEGQGLANGLYTARLVVDGKLHVLRLQLIK